MEAFVELPLLGLNYLLGYQVTFFTALTTPSCSNKGDWLGLGFELVSLSFSIMLVNY